MSATSSVQSHGGARRADFRPPLLRPVPLDTDACADKRLPAPVVAVRFEILNAQANSRTKSPSLKGDAFAMAERRRTRNSWENDGHAQ